MLHVIGLETAQTESAIGSSAAGLWIIGLVTLGADVNRTAVDAIAVETAVVTQALRVGQSPHTREVACRWLEQNLHGELAALAAGADEFENRVNAAADLLAEHKSS